MTYVDNYYTIQIITILLDLMDGLSVILKLTVTIFIHLINSLYTRYSDHLLQSN